jgi:hypothetical protein
MAEQESAAAPPAAAETSPAGPQDVAGPLPAVGDPVRLCRSRPYLKTADPMPMLRPPDLVDPDETGRVMEVRPRGLLAVRFRRGTFLLEADDLIPSTEDP